MQHTTSTPDYLATARENLSWLENMVSSCQANVAILNNMLAKQDWPSDLHDRYVRSTSNSLKLCTDELAYFESSLAKAQQKLAKAVRKWARSQDLQAA